MSEKRTSINVCNSFAFLKGKVSNSSLGGLYQFLEANFEGPDIGAV